MDVKVCVRFDGTAYRVGWISLQPRGDVSLGLNARALVAPDFKAKEFVWSAPSTGFELPTSYRKTRELQRR